MGIKFSNNASANIIQALTSTATSVSVTEGKGDLFPSLTEGDYFYATLAGNNGLEIVKVTNRIKDTMTIERAQDNTTALSFDTGDLFELRIVAADFTDTFSEVNDKLEASIEETTSRVDFALSSKAPILHASSSTEYGAGSSEQYGHLKTHDEPDYALTAAEGHALSPAGAAELDTALRDLVSTKISSVNGLTPDKNGNVDVGGMPLGTIFPYTGKDVPAGTLRADGSTYTNMQSAFPDFYEWVVNSGLTVSLSSYSLVEGSCGYYGIDTDTGTVRMPTLAAGVFGASVVSQYGQSVEAGLPNITGAGESIVASDCRGALSTELTGVYTKDNNDSGYWNTGYIELDASRSSYIYGRSDTVTPSHVKYPWVIVVYNAAIPASVAQAGEFIELLDGKLDKSGGTITGNISFSRGLLQAATGTYAGLELNGNKENPAGGATFVARAPDAQDNPNAAIMISRDETNFHIVALQPNGDFLKDGNHVLTSAGGTLNGDLFLSQNSWIAKNVNTGELVLCGGTNWDQGAFVSIHGQNHEGREGVLDLTAYRPGYSTCKIILEPGQPPRANGSQILTAADGFPLSIYSVGSFFVNNTYTVPAGGSWLVCWWRITGDSNVGWAGTYPGGTVITVGDDSTSGFVLRYA